MSSTILIFFSFLAGYLLKRGRILPESAPVTLNGYIIYLSLPAITLYHIHKIHFNLDVLYPVLMPWIIFIFAFLIVSLMQKYTGLNRTTAGALVLTCGLGNTSFIGFPLIEYLYGKDALSIAVLADQPGTFTVLSTLGVATAAYYSSGKIEYTDILKKIFYFPPFISFIVAIFLNGNQFPIWLDELLLKLGDTLTPIALVSVGFQIDLKNIPDHFRELVIGLSYKLLLAPLLIHLLYEILMDNHSKMVKITQIEAAMAPMITGGIIAARYGLNPLLVSSIIGMGIPVSFITIFIWYNLL